MIEDIFKTHKSVFVGFSGGKDSSALVELCRPWAERVTLVSVDTGYLFPHMLKHIESYAKDFRLQWVRSDQQAHWEQAGLPSRVVPTNNVNMYGRNIQTEPKIQAWPLCCLSLIVEPLQNFLRSQADAVFLHGQRFSEVSPGYHPSPNAFECGNDIGGYTSYAPLRDWSEDEVMKFLSDRGVALPMQYKFSRKDFSLDCWNCPAMLQTKKIEFMKEHYPVLLDRAVENLKITQSAAQIATLEMLSMIDLATKPTHVSG